MIKICKVCNKEFTTNWKKKKYCSYVCRSLDPEFMKNLTEHNRRIIKDRWKNHKYAYSANGYIMSKVIYHPYKNNRGYVYKHRLIMEFKLGRYLKPEEVVHHIDGNKLNNRINNLKVFSSTNEHTRFHGLNGDLR